MHWSTLSFADTIAANKFRSSVDSSSSIHQNLRNDCVQVHRKDKGGGDTSCPKLTRGKETVPPRARKHESRRGGGEDGTRRFIRPGDLPRSGRVSFWQPRGEAVRVGVGFSRRGAAEKPKVGGKSMTAMTRRVCPRAYACAARVSARDGRDRRKVGRRGTTSASARPREASRLQGHHWGSCSVRASARTAPQCMHLREVWVRIARVCWRERVTGSRVRQLQPRLLAQWFSISVLVADGRFAISHRGRRCSPAWPPRQPRRGPRYCCCEATSSFFGPLLLQLFSIAAVLLHRLRARGLFE